MIGRGIDTSNSRAISDAYLKYGCAVNISGGTSISPPSELNRHPIYDAARRFVKDFLRIVPRAQLTGYAVTGGKSQLWFTRNAPLLGTAVDLFTGIGPSPYRVLSGDIQPGVVYTVRSSSIHYNGPYYGTGSTFTGVAGVTTYTGGGQVYEYEGIRHDAPPQGTTNEWLMGLWLAPEGFADTAFKPEVYADRFMWIDRCQVDSQALAYPGSYLRQALAWHVARGQRPAVVTENTTGERYTAATNTSSSYLDADQMALRYGSCRIYEPDLTIDSVTSDGTEVCVTLSGRLHHYSGAPSSIARSVGSWDITALRSEPARTLENGLRMYLYAQSTGTHCVAAGGKRVMLGDVAADSVANISDQISAWDVWGSCLPTFRFVRLPRRVYEDDNDTPDSQDRKFDSSELRVWDFYLRAMVEGFIDPRSTSIIENCAVTSGTEGTPTPTCSSNGKGLFEFTWPTANYEASTRNTPVVLPPAVRSDLPEGYGPMPNTTPYAEVFNQYVRLINLCTKVRMDLPWKLQTRTVTARGQNTIAPDGVIADCTTGCSDMAWSGAAPGTGNLPTSDTGWVDADFVYAASAASFPTSQAAACGDDGYHVVTEVQTVDWRVTLNGDGLENAIPPAWADLVPDHLGVLFCQVDAVWTTSGGLGGSPTLCNALTGHHVPCHFETEVTTTAQCTFAEHGSINLGPPADSMFWAGYSGGGQDCGGGSGHARWLNPLTTSENPPAYIDVPTVAQS